MAICFNLVAFFGLFVVGLAGIGGCSGKGREMDLGYIILFVDILF